MTLAQRASGKVIACDSFCGDMAGSYSDFLGWSKVFSFPRPKDSLQWSCSGLRSGFEVLEKAFLFASSAESVGRFWFWEISESMK